MREISVDFYYEYKHEDDDWYGEGRYCILCGFNPDGMYYWHMKSHGLDIPGADVEYITDKRRVLTRSI